MVHLTTSQAWCKVKAHQSQLLGNHNKVTILFQIRLQKVWKIRLERKNRKLTA
jgi:hypothetical protein